MLKESVVQAGKDSETFAGGAGASRPGEIGVLVNLVVASKSKLSAMDYGAVPPYSNVLPLLMAPVAVIGGAQHVHLAGFDGDHLNSRENFWTHSTSVQYEEQLESVRHMHPEFFNLNYSEYRETVSSQIDDVLTLLRAIGCKVTIEGPTGHTSLQSAVSVERLHSFV